MPYYHQLFAANGGGIALNDHATEADHALRGVVGRSKRDRVTPWINDRIATHHVGREHTAVDHCRNIGRGEICIAVIAL